MRAKTLGSGAFLALADEVVRVGRAYGADVIVNDRADLARISGAAGVHVGQEDLDPAAARHVVGSSAIVGRSTHTLTQIESARRQPISYLAVGPVFGTTSRTPAIRRSVSRSSARLRRSGAASSEGEEERLPIVAIGGITLERAASVIAAGAASVAVISDLLVGGDPERRVREYLDRLESSAGRAGRPGASRRGSASFVEWDLVFGKRCFQLRVHLVAHPQDRRRAVAGQREPVPLRLTHVRSETSPLR